MVYVRKIVQDDQHLVQFLHLQLLGRLRDLALLLDDAPQRRLVPILPVGLVFLHVHPQVLLDILLDGNPAVIDVYARTEDADSLKHAPVLLQNQADQSHGFAGLAGAEEDARTRDQGHHGVRGLFAAVFWHRKQLDFPHSLFCLYFPNSTQGTGRRVRECIGVYRRTAGVFRAIRAASLGA